jgi:hypothetical protein
MRADPSEGLVDVFDGLDEVGLTDDDVHVLGLVDGHCVQFHERLLR